MQPQLQAQAPAREFAFTSADFQRISKLIYEHAGISLAPTKQEMVYSRLARRLRLHGLSSFSQYLELLDNPKSEEWESFVNALTTNLTSFFREPHHFAELTRFLERRRRSNATVNIWCSAASTGEEPYSLGMTAVDAHGSFTPPVTIVATDLDTSALEKAAAGIYSDERVAKLRRDQLQRFFLKGTGSRAGCVRVRKELRDLVTFRQLNLLDTQWPVRGPFDAIFCRNVMIYFDKPTQRKVLEKFAPLLARDGLLFAGHSESFLHSADLFHLRGNTVYELAHPVQNVASGGR
jgi:chemotaxis protein methyltransferase CheR